MSGFSPEQQDARSGSRRTRRLGAALRATLLVGALAAAGPASAQSTQIFLELVGQNGPISALSGTPTSGYTDHSPIHQLGANAYVETFAPPVLIQRPIRLVKDVDGASPRILEALTTFEPITKCTIRYVVMSGTPSEFFRMELTGPALAGLTASALSNGPNAPTEVLSISYASIQYVYTPLGP